MLRATGGGGAEISVSSFHALAEILYGQPHVFRAMGSWKRLSLSMTPGARMQMISAPNIDRLDFLPLPNKGALLEGGGVTDAAATGQGGCRNAIQTGALSSGTYTHPSASPR